MPRIVIDQTRCKGCALCTIACPRQLIVLSDHINKSGYLPAVISEKSLERCTSCALCAQICPDVAISVWRPKKEASR